MSAHQMLGGAYAAMTTDMRGKLHNYQLSLEHRYGDPAVYAAQQEEMAAQQAVVAYAEAKTREQALSSAYGKNRDRIRTEHKSRLERFARDKPPRYLEVDSAQPLDPTSEPPQRARPPAAKSASSRAPANAR